MQRLFSALILVFFLTQTIDAPIFAFNNKAVSSKTCCGRAICSCDHGKSAPCPLSKKTKARNSDAQKGTALKKKIAVPDTHGHCHLKAKADSKSHQVQEAEKKSKPFRFVLKTAPCSKDTPKSLLHQTASDFILPDVSMRAHLLNRADPLFDMVLFIPQDFSLLPYQPPRF